LNKSLEIGARQSYNLANLGSQLLRYPTTAGPSWWYGLLAVPGFLIGAALFYYFLVTGIRSASANLTQVVVPGDADLNLTKPGSYTIFLEQPSEVNGKIYSSDESVASLTCKVTAPRSDQSTNQAAEKPVLLRHTSVNTNYSLGNRAGRSIFEFEAQDAGVYHLHCAYPEGSAGPETVMAIGTGVSGKIFKTLMFSFWGLFVGLVLGGSVIVIIATQRNKIRRAALFELSRAAQVRLARQLPPSQG
jgi:hypothetical protein